MPNENEWLENLGASTATTAPAAPAEPAAKEQTANDWVEGLGTSRGLSPGAEDLAKSEQAGVNVGRSPQEHAAYLKGKGYSAESITEAMKSYKGALAARQVQGETPAFSDSPLGAIKAAVRDTGKPWVSWFQNPEKEKQDAEKRIAAGTATDHDYLTVARYQQKAVGEHQIGEQYGFGGHLLMGMRNFPALVGEFMAGGAVAKVAGKALPGLAGRVLTGEAGASVGRAPLLSAQNATWLQALGTNAGRMAIINPLVPSGYMEVARQKNIENGRPADDWRGLPPALLHSYGQLLVLNQVFKGATGAPKPGLVAGTLGSLRGGATGAIESSLADSATNFADLALPKAYKISTGYGTFEKLVQGDVSGAARKFGVDGLTFAMLGGMHRFAMEGKPVEAAKTVEDVASAYAKDLQTLKNLGYTEEQAQAKMEDVGRIIKQATDAGTTVPDLNVAGDHKSATADALRQAVKPTEPTESMPELAQTPKPAAPAETPSVAPEGRSAGPGETPPGPEIAQPAKSGEAVRPETAAKASETPTERYFRTPDSKGAEDNVDAAVKELVGDSFAGKWFSRTFEGNAGYKGHVQLEFHGGRLGGPKDVVEKGEKDVRIGGESPMYMHPALTAIRYRGPENTPQFQKLQDVIKTANQERAAKGIDPIELLTGKAAKEPRKPAEPAKEPSPESAKPKAGEPILAAAAATATAPIGAKGGEPIPTPMEVIKTEAEQFGVPVYTEKTPPGFGGKAAGVYMPEQGGEVLGKMWAQNMGVHYHEVMHHLTNTKGLTAQLDPATLPPDVVRGLHELDYSAARRAQTPTTLSMIEGAAEWYRRRQTEGLTEQTAATPHEKAAVKFLEDWAKDNNLTEKMDKTRKMYQKWAAANPIERAATLINPTGRPEAPIRSPGEQAATLRQRFSNWVDDHIFNSLAVLKRAGMEGAYKIWSRLLFADRQLATRWGNDGIGTIINGKYTQVGPSINQIKETLQPQDLQPVNPEMGGWWGKLKEKFSEPRKVTPAGLFTIARHITDEVARGQQDLINAQTLKAAAKTPEEKAAAQRAIKAAQSRMSIVPEDQLALYQDALQYFQQDPAFVQRATEFANRLTEGYNAGLRALGTPEVHRLSAETVDRLIAKRPTYVPTTRIREETDWTRAVGPRKGENMSAVFYERSGSGEQIVDPLVNYELRLRQVAGQWAEQMRRNAVAEYLQEPGMAEWALRNPEIMPSESPADPYALREKWDKDGNKATWFWYGRDGTLQNWRIKDKALYDLLTGQQGDSNSVAQFFKWMGKLGFNTPWGRVEPLGASGRAVRAGATAFSMAFQVRNAISPFRDPYEFAKNTIDQASVKQLPQMLARLYQYEALVLAGKSPNDPLVELFIRERGRSQKQFDWETPGIETVHSKAGLLLDYTKKFLNVAGAGELAPRFLEFTNRLKQLGWTEAKLTAELNKAKAAAKAGAPYVDPIDWYVLQDAMEAANEVTVPFDRQGIVTREINRLVPFFGPSVSGLSKSVRNWRTNAKGASFALGAFLASRLAHWLLYSDEDWYQQLSASDRYNNFVINVPGLGLRRIPGARDLEIPVGGSLITVLDMLAKKNPDFKGLLEQSMAALLPPAPLPPAIKVATEEMRNKDWMGRPIVPRRDEEASAEYNLLHHQAPYAIQQLTGGRGELSARGLGIVPFTEVRNAHRSVDELFDREKQLQGEALAAKRTGERFESAAELTKLEAAKQKIVELSHKIRGERKVGTAWKPGSEPSDEEKKTMRDKQIAIAKAALAK